MNATKRKTSSRALATPDNNVGSVRYDLYKNAYKRINDSIEAGYYLEAVTLIESLTSDRLQHRLNFVKGNDSDRESFVALIAQVRSRSRDATLCKLLGPELDEAACRRLGSSRARPRTTNEWRHLRNEAIHRLVKVADGDLRLWDEKVSGLSLLAKIGLRYLRRLDKILKAELRIEKKSRSSTLSKKRSRAAGAD